MIYISIIYVILLLIAIYGFYRGIKATEPYGQLFGFLLLIICGILFALFAFGIIEIGI